MNLVENSVWNFDVNGKPALNALGELEQKLGDLKTAQKELTRGTKEWTENKAEIKALEESIKQTREEMGNAGMTVKQLEGYYRQLNKELKDLTPGTDQYIEKTKELQDVNGRLQAVRNDVRAVAEEANSTKSVWTNVKEWITGALAAFTVVGLLESLVDFTRESLKMAVEVTDAFGGIQKASGMTEEEVKSLNAEIQKIDTRTAQESLLDIAQVGGQIGIAKDQMLGFVESVDKAVVALGDEFSGGAEEVAGTMGTLSKLFKETKELEAGKAINDIGSAINELGAAGTATGPVVADFAMRMGQLGDLSPQISQTLGLGAAFQEMGLTAEIAAGGLTNILSRAASSTNEFSKQIGLTEVEFIKLINSNPNEVILQLAASFKGLPVDQVVKQLNDLGLKSQEAQKVMMLLADQTDTVREKQELAGKAMEEGTSLTKEFATMNNTAAAMVEKQEKQLDQLKLQLGTALLPALTNVTAGVIAFVKGIMAIPEFLSENKEMIMALGVAIVSFNGHLIIATATSLAHAAAEKGRLVWTQSATTAQMFFNAALTANPIGAVIAAVALFVGGLITLYNHSETVRNAIDKLWNGLKSAANAVGSFFGILSSENEKSLNKQKSDNDKHLSDKKANEKKTAEEIAADAKKAKDKELADKAAAEKKDRDAKLQAEKDAKNKELADKSAANAKHRSDELAKATAAAKQAADAEIKANNDALKTIQKMEEDASIKSISDDLARELVSLQLKTKRELEKVAESKANTTIKTQWEKALTDQLVRDMDKVTSDYNKKRMDDETKRIAEIKKLEDAQRSDRQTKEFANTKTILETQLANEKLNINQRQALKIQLINLERQQELARIEEVATKERAKALETSQQLMKLAGDDAAKKKQIETETAATLRAIDTQRIAQTDASNTKHQNDLKIVEAANLEARKANQGSFFNAVKALMNGDFSAFMDILNKKLANDKAANNESLQNFAKTGTEVLGIAKQGMELMGKMSELRLAKELKNITKEKTEQLKSWEDKYEKGLISKDEYEGAIDKINKDAIQKEYDAKVKAWKREQKMQIGMALINAAMAALKSLAMMGFPLGLIGVVASAALAAVQIGIIKSQSPPSMAKGGYIRNAGVPQGPLHGAKYGDSGIGLVRRDTGEEVGEMEGDEPIMILSRNTYKNNRHTIDNLLDSSLHRNGAPIHAAKGTVFGSDGGSYRDLLEPLSYGTSYLFGSKKKKAQKAADDAAATAAADAAEMQAELDAELAAVNAGLGDTGGYYSGMDPYGSVDAGDPSGTTAATSAEIGKSQAMMDKIGKNTGETTAAVMSLKSSVDALGGKLDAIIGSTNRGADGAWAAASASNRAADAASMSSRNDL